MLVYLVRVGEGGEGGEERALSDEEKGE